MARMNSQRMEKLVFLILPMTSLAQHMNDRHLKEQRTHKLTSLDTARVRNDFYGISPFNMCLNS